MKPLSNPSQENEVILNNLFDRQRELYKLTYRMIELSKRSKQNALQAENTFNWFVSLKNNNSNLLSKAV